MNKISGLLALVSFLFLICAECMPPAFFQYIKLALGFLGPSCEKVARLSWNSLVK